MKKSAAIEIIRDFWIETSDGDMTLGEDSAEGFLDYLIESGFPIPCNKKGKFDWDKEEEK